MSLYRECRPARFKEIVSQAHVTKTLQNAIAQDRLAHAYLFCGPRGTGKTSTARVLAKALNCPNVADAEPCGVCEVCRGIAGGEGIDVVEMDAASNRGIDEIRTLRERVRLAPVGGKFKVYVIDEVHMLTTEAFNALLKTIEEPPAKVVFVLCTTEAYRVPATIVSRCQRFDFHPIPTQDIAGHLSDLIQKYGFDVEPAAARFIARVSTGSLRDALSILDQCLAYASGLVTLEAARNVVGALDGRILAEMAGALIRGDAGEAFCGLERLMADGRDPREVARGLAAHMRDLVLYRLSGPGPELLGPGADDPQTLKVQAATVSDDFLFEAVDVLSTTESEMRYAPQPRLALEARLLRLCSLAAGGAAGQGTAALPVETSAGRPTAARGLSASASVSGPAEPNVSPQKPPVPVSPATQAPEEAATPSREEPATSTPEEPSTRAPGPPAAAADSRQQPVPASERLPEVNLERMWPQIRDQLPAPYAGLLADSTLVRGGDGLLILVSSSVVAEHVRSKHVPEKVSDLLLAQLGCRVEVGVRVSGGSTGLFGESEGLPGASPGAAGRTRPAGRSTPARSAGKTERSSPITGRQPGQAGPDSPADRDESLSRRAEALFAAEEVGKGDEQGDEPR